MILMAERRAQMNRKLLAEGVVLAGATAFALAFPPDQFAPVTVAVLLVLIAAIYVGFALADGDPKGVAPLWRPPACAVHDGLVATFAAFRFAL
ncbi:hypothetical protein [Methylocystis parvus]|uniref:Uncharacterized protein n=1 Tax=Methylocystis parvus TaxID=134 RepID=A0A6B8M6D0_9HYPH|nr:hypothetical protein [Methylocystis parvus]QGM97976.1 hypothetical protein F7D14_11145 [Methylocystis parvus]WBK01710.1 hypothetical protein MMG94_08425 [Methylocystis parvus OBBP]